MGEWHHKKEKAEERESGIRKQYISREEDERKRGMREKNGRASMREK